MSSRRPLAEMLGDITGGALDALAMAAAGIRVREMEVSLPVEIVLAPQEGPFELLGDLPRTLTRTAFDVPPGRLRVRWRREET